MGVGLEHESRMASLLELSQSSGDRWWPASSSEESVCSPPPATPNPHIFFSPAGCLSSVCPHVHLHPSPLCSGVAGVDTLMGSSSSTLSWVWPTGSSMGEGRRQEATGAGVFVLLPPWRVSKDQLIPQLKMTTLVRWPLPHTQLCPSKFHYSSLPSSVRPRGGDRASLSLALGNGTVPLSPVPCPWPCRAVLS